MKLHKTVEEFLASSPAWNNELAQLREIMLDCGLDETVKWGMPVYCHDGKMVAGIGGFKSYFGLWFFQGALLSDPKKLLINAQEGRTKALRQIRFESAKEIRKTVIKAYVKEAVQLAQQGKGIKPARDEPVKVPQELSAALARNRAAAKQFDQMRKTLRREYADYIASAKQAATKTKRLEKIIPLIESGVGLNDKYRRSSSIGDS